MDKLIIREAKISDAESIAKVHIETWQFAYRNYLPDDYLNNLSVEKRQETWKVKLSHPQPKQRNYVGEVDGKIVGFCSVGASRDEDTNENTGELFAIYTDSTYMNKGIGTALMKEGLKYLKETGFKNATLWVLTSNKKTREFYEHKGWSPDGKTKTEQRTGFVLNETRYAVELG